MKFICLDPYYYTIEYPKYTVDNLVSDKTYTYENNGTCDLFPHLNITCNGDITITIANKVYDEEKDEYLKSIKDEVLTNADALIGRQAIVTEEINPDKNTGRVKIDGDDWKAEASEVLAVGEKVEVVSRDSIILKVKSLK